jgi:putative transposase
MLGSEAGRSFREEVSDEQEKAHAGADHHGTAGGLSRSGERQDGGPGEPGSLGISEQTYYRWRQEFVGMKVDQARRFKDLERENAQLKRAVANLTLDKLIMEEAAKGNF